MVSERISPLRRRAVIGAGVQPAARVNSCEVSGCGAAARIFNTSNCFFGQIAGRQPCGGLGRQAEHGGQPRAGLLANAGRQDGLQHLAPVAEIIVGDPVA